MFSFCKCYPYFFCFWRGGWDDRKREKGREGEVWEEEEEHTTEDAWERKSRRDPCLLSRVAIFYPAWLQKRFKALLSLRPENRSPVSFSGGSGWGGCCWDRRLSQRRLLQAAAQDGQFAILSKINLLATTEAQIGHALCSGSAKWDTQGSISRENQWCKNAFHPSVTSSWDAHGITFYCFNASVTILV